MRPDERFTHQPGRFWACVRSLSQEIGYTIRKRDRIRIPELQDIRRAFTRLGLNGRILANADETPTALAQLILEYFQYRAGILEAHVRPLLMRADEAGRLFEEWRARLDPRCPLPMNKQKGTKRAHAYLTGLVNMHVEHHSRGSPCDYDPRKLTTVTRDGTPIRTLARRIDGAFPSVVDPVAIWEVKEYYYTTTFGSRVADGVYETLLDGMELAELRAFEGIDIKHYLMLDAYDTWWRDGKAYLCRVVDMMNMGYVDEVLFGREVVSELPRLVAAWSAIAARRGGTGAPP